MSQDLPWRDVVKVMFLRDGATAEETAGGRLPLGKGFAGEEVVDRIITPSCGTAARSSPYVVVRKAKSKGLKEQLLFHMRRQGREMEEKVKGRKREGIGIGILITLTVGLVSVRKWISAAVLVGEGSEVDHALFGMFIHSANPKPQSPKLEAQIL